MGKKKSKKCETCKCDCVYFPQEPSEILSEKAIDGVKYRKVIRRCAYDESVINSFKKQCPRKDGPWTKESDHERLKRLKEKIKRENE